jgi:hypothetical protein
MWSREGPVECTYDVYARSKARRVVPAVVGKIIVAARFHCPTICVVGWMWVFGTKLEVRGEKFSGGVEVSVGASW